MGTVLSATAIADNRADALAALEPALRAIADAESLLSTWRDDTPLSRIDGAPAGVATPCPAELCVLIDRVLSFARATDRAFDPTIGALLGAWDLRGKGREPDDAALAAAQAATGPWLVRIDQELHTVERLDPDLRIEEGAFGKGYGLARARDALRASRARAALLDIGGQLLAVGPPADEAAFEVGVADPRDRARSVATVALCDTSVSTSGQGVRSVVVGGRRHGHILDPRTGRPCPAYGSVTVLAPDPLEADVLSTALYVLGPAQGLAFAASRPGVGVLYLIETESGLSAVLNSPMDSALRTIDADIPCFLDTTLAPQLSSPPLVSRD